MGSHWTGLQENGQADFTGCCAIKGQLKLKRRGSGSHKPKNHQIMFCLEKYPIPFIRAFLTSALSLGYRRGNFALGKQHTPLTSSFLKGTSPPLCTAHNLPGALPFSRARLQLFGDSLMLQRALRKKYHKVRQKGDPCPHSEFVSCS